MSLPSTIDSEEMIIQFACKMPKAELHLHLEGTFKPEMVMKIAKRNDLELPEAYNTLEKLKKAYVFKDLFSFLDLYTICGGVLRTEQDFEELMFDYLQDAHHQNIVYAEIAVGYPTHLDNGVPFDTIQKGVEAGMEKARKKYGIKSSIIIDINRGHTEAEAEKILNLCKPYIGKSISAIGLAFAENKDNNPGKFKNVYEQAHKLGLNKTAHAGEAMGADYVREAVEVLKTERIDHGVRVIEDSAVMKLLADRKIAITVCPLSNVCLKVFPSLEVNRLKELIANNIIVTINSDDPAYFGGNLNDNFTAIIKANHFTLEEIYQLGKNSILASFLPSSEKQKFIQQLDDFYLNS